MIKTGISAATFRCNCTSSADSIRDYSGTECSRRGSRTWEKFKNNFFLVFRFTCSLLQSCCSLLTSLSSCLWAASEGAPFGYILHFTCTYNMKERKKAKRTFFSSVRFMFSNILSNSSMMFWSLIWPIFHPLTFMIIATTGGHWLQSPPPLLR